MSSLWNFLNILSYKRADTPETGTESPEQQLEQRRKMLNIVLELPKFKGNPKGAEPSESKLLDGHRQRLRQLVDGATDDTGMDDAWSQFRELKDRTNEVLQAIGERRQEGASIRDGCVKMLPPTGTTAAERKTLLDKRLELTGLVPELPSTQQLSDARKKLKALVTLLKGLKEIAAKRLEHAQLEARVAKRLGEVLEAVPEKATQYLRSSFDDLRDKGSKADTAKKYADVIGELGQFETLLGKADAYGKLSDEVYPLHEIYKDIADPSHVSALVTFMSDARDHALAGRFDAAVSSLQQYLSHGDLTAARKYYRAVASLRSRFDKRGLGRLKKHPEYGLLGVNVDDLVKTAKQPALGSSPDFSTAANQVAAVEQQLTELASYFARIKQVLELKAPAIYDKIDSSRQTELDDNLDAARLQAGQKKFAEAKSKLDQLDTTNTLFAELAAYTTKRRSADGLHKALVKATSNAQIRSWMTSQLSAVDTDVSNSRYVDASNKLDALVPKLEEASKLLDALADVMSQLPGTTLVDPAVTLAESGEFSKARAAVSTLAKQLDQVVTWNERLPVCEALVAQLSGEQQGEVAKIVQRAKDVVTTQGDYGAALAILAEVRFLPGMNARDAATEGYLKLKPRMEKAVAGLLPRLAGSSLDKLRKELQDKLAAALALYDNDSKPADALAGLEELAKLAAKVAVFAAERETAVSVKKALDAAHNPPTTSIYSSSDEQDQLARAVPAADSKVCAGNHDAAIKELRDFRAAARELSKKAAQQFETEDDGHSVAAHGADVTVDQQKDRVQNGKRPDGKTKMFTRQATNFDSPNSWLASRQLALDKARVEFPSIDFDSTTVPSQKKVRVFVEHGRPIDTCVVGVKPGKTVKQGGPLEGETDDQGYETFEVWKGLTRSRSDFWFKGGKWVLHQQFPHPDDWSDERKSYLAPLPDSKAY